MRQERADIRDEGVERHPQRILHQGTERRHALGARRRHILLLQLVEQIGAQAADHPGGAGEANDDDRDPKMREDRERLSGAPRRVEIARVHQAADRQAEIDVGEIEQHQREKKVRRRQAEKADEGQRVVAPAVLVRRRVDADREGDDIGEDDGCHRDDDGEEQAIADDVANRQVVGEGVAEIALQQAGHPVEILFPDRLVETVLRLEEGDLLQIDSLALALQFGDVGGEVIARRQLDDDEDDNADGDQGRDHDEQALHDIAEHGGLRALAAERPTPARRAASLPAHRRRTRTYPGGRCRNARPGPNCRCLRWERCAACC